MTLSIKLENFMEEKAKEELKKILSAIQAYFDELEEARRKEGVAKQNEQQKQMLFMLFSYKNNYFNKPVLRPLDYERKDRIKLSA